MGLGSPCDRQHVGTAVREREETARGKRHLVCLSKALQEVDRYLVAAPHCAQQQFLVTTERVGEAFWLASRQLGLGLLSGPKPWVGRGVARE